MLTFTFFMFLSFLSAVFWMGIVAWSVSRFHLQGPDLSRFDTPVGERFSSGPQPSPEMQEVLASLGRLQAAGKKVPRRQRTIALRKAMDEQFANRKFDATFSPVSCDGVPAEWVLAPGADPARRTLYIHGGAYMVGSPRSHRPLTSAFSELTGGAVLAIDYRLMPEYQRRAGIEDCRTAYRWMLDNGPDGSQPASAVFVAGDSAGGNLTLSLIAWVRDQRLRAPDAAVALSPATDSTGASPSIRSNLKTDPMLGPMYSLLLKVPRPLLLWLAWSQYRRNPSSPDLSPVFGNLANLPPVLVQVSDSETLRDDAVRYVNRAREAGSPVRLQVWEKMVHVWQIFNPLLPQAREALEEIRKFINEVAPAQSAAPALPAARPGTAGAAAT